MQFIQQSSSTDTEHNEVQLAGQGRAGLKTDVFQAKAQGGLQLPGGDRVMDEEDKMLLAQIRAMERENQMLLGHVMTQPAAIQPFGESEHPKYTDQHGSSPGGQGSSHTPWGTEDTLKQAVAKTAAMESSLLQLNMERKDLDGELQRLPEGGPRNVRDRKRKAAIEHRMEVLDKDIGSLRMQLRNPHLV
eukprot:TRINITY_DN27858_c0_g1_i1.p1 TRINITY_DN27858_c0_g1~~TRINITY_DN27858_c0_g1_i1.p1  ORF type:complete len:189 (+),score=72.32 TRINITY_DN27858_c0_g1_i1:220-786(+)